MLNNDTTSNEHGNIKRYKRMQALISCAENTDISVVKTEPMSPKRADTYQTLSTYTEVMESPLPFTIPYKLKDPIVVLERCDKIWETLKFIKSIQEQNSHHEDVDLIEKRYVENSSTHSKLPYITYHPVLSNDNRALPNFKFSVKRKKKLFHCDTCGKEYREVRSLRSHSQKIHGIIIPQQRQRKTTIHTNKNVKPATMEQNSMQNIDKNNEENVKQNIRQYVENYFDQIVAVEQKNNHKTKEENFTELDTQLLAKRANEGKINSECKTNLLTKDSLQIKNKMSGSRVYMCRYEKCPLCKRAVKSLSKHLTEYHKIGCPNIVMRHFKEEAEKNNSFKSIQNDEGKILLESFNDTHENVTKKRKNVEKDEKSIALVEKKYKSNRTGKVNIHDVLRTTQISRSVKGNMRTCDICYGTYASATTYYKHRRTHRRRGENKDNFHKCNNRYLNSPLYNGGMVNQRMVKATLLNPSETHSLRHCEIDNDYSGLIRSSSKEREIFEGAYSECTCTCGKSFQDPHTLFLHKTNCTFSDIREESLMDFDGERDIGTGINITIKKKNDSYEIVGKDSTNENIQKNVEFSKSCHIFNELVAYSETASDQLIRAHTIRSSEHRVNHNTLKIEATAENNIVQIEDSQNAICHVNDEISDKLEEIMQNVNFEKIEESDNPHAVPTLTELCETILTSQSETSNLSDIQIVKEPLSMNSHKQWSSTQFHANLMCPCGAKFKTLRSCNSHIAKCHPLFLNCGYCSEKFRSVSEYNSHRCNITFGKTFQDIISCPVCKDVLESTKKFNKHVAAKHYNPNTPYQCYECPKQFTSTSGRHSHYRTKHGSSSCNICGQQVSLIKKLKHEGYHNGLGFPCHTCKITYARMKTLHNHQVICHSEESNELVTCKLCFKTMKGKSLKWHLYTHRNTMRCKVCKKVCCDRRSLEHHIVIRHRGMYPWRKCHLCTRNFITNSFLERHLRDKKCLAYTKKVMRNGNMLNN